MGDLDLALAAQAVDARVSCQQQSGVTVNL